MRVPEQSGSAWVASSRMALGRSGWAPRNYTGWSLARFNRSEIQQRNLLGCDTAAAYPKGPKG